MQKPIFLDTTLRDGEQSPGVYFTHTEKLQIASRLDDIGIDILEVGIPSMGSNEQENLRALKRLGLKAEILSWNRLLIDDVVASLQADVQTMHLSIPTSDVMIEHKIGKPRNWIIPQMEKVFSFAQKQGAIISFGAEDASRTNLEFLSLVFAAAQAFGAKRVRFADTLGIMTPTEVAYVIGYLSKEITIPIDFHGHNDFGLATANALSAWENGANVLSCSLLGLGERAGNTSLEELAGVMKYLRGSIVDFDFVALKDLCSTISKWIDCPIPEYKPIIGERIHSHESGIHVDGLLKESTTYEFLPPEQIGGTRKLVLGKHSGRRAIQHLAQKEGYCLDDEQIAAFLLDLRGRMAKNRGVDAQTLFQTYLTQNGRRTKV